MIFQSKRLVMMLAFMLVSLACLLVLLILSIAPRIEATNPCTQCTNVYPVGVTTSGSTYIVAPTTGYDGGTTPVTCYVHDLAFTGGRKLHAHQHVLPDRKRSDGHVENRQCVPVFVLRGGGGLYWRQLLPRLQFLPTPERVHNDRRVPIICPDPILLWHHVEQACCLGRHNALG